MLSMRQESISGKRSPGVDFTGRTPLQQRANCTSLTPRSESQEQGNDERGSRRQLPVDPLSIADQRTDLPTFRMAQAMRTSSPYPVTRQMPVSTLGRFRTHSNASGLNRKPQVQAKCQRDSV